MTDPCPETVDAPPLAAPAADDAAPRAGSDEPTWSGRVGRGLFSACGNTESTSTNSATARPSAACYTSRFTQELEVVSGGENPASRSDTELESNPTGDLALKVTYTVEHNRDVPPDTEKTDTFTAVTLEYGF